MLELFYNLFRWQYLWIIILIWLIIDLFWIARWKDLLARVNKLVAKPSVFKRDNDPQSIPTYPREFLELLARATISSKESTSQESPEIDGWNKWFRGAGGRIFTAESPHRALGYILSLVFFSLFIYSDAIMISNSLVLMGIISPDLPPSLLRLDIAILGGALLATTVGIWTLIEMSGKGELIATEDLNSAQKKIFKTMAIFVTLFAAVVMIALAVQRLISVELLASSPVTDLTLSFVLFGLISINSSLAAALTFQAAASGLLVLIYVLLSLVALLLPILAFLADVMWRLVYIVIDILLWLLLTPIIAIPYAIGKSFRWIQ